MAGVDFEDRLGALAHPPVRGEHLFELAVGAEFRRDQAGDAVGQAVGGAHVLDLIAERLLEEGEQRRDRRRRLGRRGLAPSASGIALMSAAPCVTDLNGLPS